MQECVILEKVSVNSEILPENGLDRVMFSSRKEDFNSWEE